MTHSRKLHLCSSPLLFCGWYSLTVLLEPGVINLIGTSRSQSNTIDLCLCCVCKKSYNNLLKCWMCVTEYGVINVNHYVNLEGLESAEWLRWVIFGTLIHFFLASQLLCCEIMGATNWVTRMLLCHTWSVCSLMCVLLTCVSSVICLLISRICLLNHIHLLTY